MSHSPALGRVPGINRELVIKATTTGITFLHERKFNQRYLGSKKCAIDRTGKFHSDAAALDKSIEADKKSRETGKRKGKERAQKKQASPPALKCCYSDPGGSGAISVNTAIPENFYVEIAKYAPKVAKKERLKAYTINKREARQRILGYTNTMKGRKELYFFTVSFPGGTADDICYQAFNTWLTKLRTPFKDKTGKKLRPMLRDYLWIAERQMGDRLKEKKAPTHTIHFHIAIPHFMHVQKANALMRGTLKNLAKKGVMPGAVCNGKNGDQYYLPCIAKYNGVDICKNKKTGRVVNFAVKKGSRALATYLTKYITKNDAGVPDETGHIAVPAFTHLAWHNSRGFSCLFTGVTFTIQEFTDLGFRPFLNKVRQFRMNFATFVPWLYGPPPLLYDHLFSLNSSVHAILSNEPLPIFDSLLFTTPPKVIFVNGTYQTQPHAA